MAVDTSQFRNGLKIELDGEPFTIVYFQHVKPGKGGAFVRTKVKNLRTGRTLDRRFRAGEKVEEADIEDRKMQYLYMDGDSLIFMDNTTYDQITVTGVDATTTGLALTGADITAVTTAQAAIIPMGMSRPGRRTSSATAATLVSPPKLTKTSPAQARITACSAISRAEPRS